MSEIKPIVQEDLLRGWGVNPDTYFGFYNKQVGILIDPFRDAPWLERPDIYKVAVQIEPPEVNRSAPEQYLLNNWKKFDLILTYYNSILSRVPVARSFYFGDRWIKNTPDDLVKDKMVSFVTSNKNFTTGHSMRMEVVNRLSNKFDLFGRGFREIKSKEEGLNKYYFSIVMENQIMDNWFTEKIVDCFMTKTIPIYYGCPNIGGFYDERGIIKFKTIEELESILSNLTIERYNEMIEYININHSRAKNDPVLEKRVEIEIKKFYDQPRATRN